MWSSGVRSSFDALGCEKSGIGLEQVGPADDVVEALGAQRGEDRPDLLAHLGEVVDDVIGAALEAGPQLGILGRDPDGAGVEVADAHHDAAGGDQGGGREAELVGAEQCGDDDVAAGPHLAVGLEHDPRAQPALDQGLLGLGQAELPRGTRPLEARERRGAGAAVVAGDDDVVGAALRDAGGDRPDARLGGELDRDRGLGVRRAQVVDQLLQVLDRVDVVVGRGRDQLDAGGRVAQVRDVVVDLRARAAGRPRRAWRPGRS